MSRTDSLFDRAHSAIVFAFRREDLRLILPGCLGLNFDTLVADKAFGDQVTELLLKLDGRGQTAELLACLCAEREQDAALAAVYAEVQGRQAQAGAGKPLFAAARQPALAVPLHKPLRVQHFTGRAAELSRLLADLQPGKVVTLCGPGGMGKTALAAEAVWTLAPGDDPPAAFPHGVIVHTFYHQPQAALALEAIARAYGIDPRPSAQDAARAALASRKALLLLDGAEAADDLDAVLQVAPTCGVLITTRRHADAPAELQDLEPLPRGESLQLLRAWAGKYAEDDAAANELVRLLGGLPLALFLVGRYLSQRRQTAGEYVPSLQEAGLGALHFADRPSRSIPLLLRRSLEQVSERARAAFGVAGVLALAPFAAEPLAAALEATPAAAHRALGELVDYGLLLRPGVDYQVTHALAHVYARTQAAPAAAVIERLALHYAALAEAESRRGPAGFAVLDPQRPHLVAVQSAALAANQWDTVRRIALQTRDYLDLKGYWADRISVARAGLVAARATKDRRGEGVFLNDLGLAYKNLGDARGAILMHTRYLAIAREIGDYYGESVALGNLGAAYGDLDETDRAIECYEQALIIGRKLGKPCNCADLGNLGLAYYSRGETRRAIDLYEQQLATAREIGDRRGEAAALGNLGTAYDEMGETHRTIELYEQQLAIVREIGDRCQEGNVLCDLGIVHWYLGKTRYALELYNEALAIAREVSDRRGEGNVLANLGQAYYSLGQTRHAIELYEQALVIDREIGNRHGESLILVNLGLVYQNLVESRRAIEMYEQALAIARVIGFRRGEGAALSSLGNAYYSIGDVHRAIETYEQALVIVRAIGDRCEERKVLNGLGTAYASLSKTRRAVELHEKALAIAREIGDRRGEGAALSGLGIAYDDLGDTRRAVELHKQSLAIARETCNRDEEGLASGRLGAVYHALGEINHAIEFYEQYLTIAQEIGNRLREGLALTCLGLAYSDLGETRRAIELYEQALVIDREIGDRCREGADLGYLADAYAALDETHRAAELYEQALVIDREISDRREEGADLGSLGNAYAALGETRRAVELYEQQLVITREIGDRRGEALGSWNLGLTYEKGGDLTRAAANMQVYVDYLQEISHPDAAEYAQQVAELKQRAGL